MLVAAPRTVRSARTPATNWAADVDPEPAWPPAAPPPRRPSPSRRLGFGRLCSHPSPSARCGRALGDQNMEPTCKVIFVFSRCSKGLVDGWTWWIGRKGQETKPNSFWGQIGKFKRKRTKKLSTTFFNAKKLFSCFFWALSYRTVMLLSRDLW